MIIYNTTFAVEVAALESFFAYLKQTYIPALLEGKILRQPRLSKILSGEGGEENVNLALQFEVESTEALEQYLQAEGRQHLEALSLNFGSSVLGFSTMMNHIPLDEL